MQTSKYLMCNANRPSPCGVCRCVSYRAMLCLIFCFTCTSVIDKKCLQCKVLHMTPKTHSGQGHTTPVVPKLNSGCNPIVIFTSLSFSSKGNITPLECWVGCRADFKGNLLFLPGIWPLFSVVQTKCCPWSHVTVRLFTKKATVRPA